MNNAQFRKLLETPRPERPSDSTSNAPAAAPALGSRVRPSIPMTPRSLTTGNNDFARQLAAHRAAQQQQPAKKFRSSAAPKGSKLGTGYVDRAAALRESEDDIEDERLQRLQALKKLAEEGHIEHEEYVKQTKLLGGDTKSTHLVRGLDFALLERVRRGEDVMDESAKEKQPGPEDIPEEDLDDKLEKALEQKVVTVERKKEKKQGELAPKPKTRAEILAELKASRQAAKEAANPSLGSKFKKIGEKKETIEETEDGVKVKHVVGADGKVKRKVKRSDKERQAKAATSPPRGARVMGMMPPPPLPGTKIQQQEEEDEDDDIFAGVGDYDPLAGLADDDDDDSDTEPSKRQKQEDEAKAETDEGSTKAKTEGKMAQNTEPKTDMLPPPRPPIKYFDESPADSDAETYKPPTSAADLLSSHPELAAALQKASKLGPVKTKEEDEREKRRKALVEAHERDSYDIDMGFGGSTNFGDDDEDETLGAKGGAKKRKRGGGPKKKGDKNSAEVVGKIVTEKYGDGKK
ncbi:hypothetical protein FPQ18DRAFT_374356 [Pyronema domesticum]|uniref:Similar to Meiotic chromosome segregation protein C1539.02 acc. no. Q9Y7Z6 n=1 Tax=Pyronema omphalodes (strain CBS 100304) TaxID=1076935 RepID=U4LQK7_PYROM|nr:hypothetical protein FPQ18DRAFT_374356 [Pyronema domesticum]CCX31625.1 Similar to Meiotic chromosome segregation protein C1539.02; acc. no. Q9Y7Z6 [Pyronema omphalodes CBS 100304]